MSKERFYSKTDLKPNAFKMNSETSPRITRGPKTASSTIKPEFTVKDQPNVRKRRNGKITTPLDTIDIVSEEGFSEFYTPLDKKEPDKPDLEEIEKEKQSGPDDSLDLFLEEPAMMYLKNIGEYPLLTFEEELTLGQQKDEGEKANKTLESAELYGNLTPKKRSELEIQVLMGKDAKDKLTVSNLRLVVSIVKKYLNRGVEFLDLVQEGNIGLQRAVEKYDYKRGFRFSTYATWWIRQAITRAIAEQARTIRVPVHIGEKIGQLIRTRRRLNQELCREVTEEELAEYMEIPVKDVDKLDHLLNNQQMLSIDMPVGEDGENTLGDFIEDREVSVPEQADEAVLRQQIDEILNLLSGGERRVLKLRFGLDDGRGRTLEEIGQEFGVSRERVRQIEAKALERLRRKNLREKLEEFLE